MKWFPKQAQLTILSRATQVSEMTYHLHPRTVDFNLCMNTVHTHYRGVVYKANYESCKGRRILYGHGHGASSDRDSQTYDRFGTGHHRESVLGWAHQLLAERVECCAFLGVLNFVQFQMETRLHIYEQGRTECQGIISVASVYMKCHVDMKGSLP